MGMPRQRNFNQKRLFPCCPSALSTTSNGKGFSLVEMLIALVFTSLLMAGMAKIFSSSISTFTTSNEAMSIQRVNRWALDLLSDELSQAGLVFPERTVTTNANEPLFSIIPDQAITCTSLNPNGTVNTETIKNDTLQFFTDVPLPVQGTVGGTAGIQGDNSAPDGTSVAADTQATINFTMGDVDQLTKGDVMVILDSGEQGKWEHPLITNGANGKIANPITFETNQANVDKFCAGMSPGIARSHNIGVPVYFIRPMQLVRFSVQPVSLDPSNNTLQTPCLVRQQTDYPDSVANSITWANIPAQVIAENIIGFKVDISFNGGAGWARSTAASPTGSLTWANIQTAAEAQLGTCGLEGNKDLSAKDWFRAIPCLLRVDITTRTTTKRAEYGTNAQPLANRTRTQTLMISPRNFGVGR